jgi:hypothetical protein
MSLGEFEPVLWVPSSHSSARRRAITLDEVTRMAVVHGPRRICAATYDAWLEVLRAADADFAFTDPPFRHSLPVSLALAAAASRPTAVLSSPCIAMASTEAMAREPLVPDSYDMVEVTLERHPLTATAGLVWNTDLPRRLQQVLFDAADAVGCVSLARAS